jgi:putative tricarboxylic transport membrane protein
MKNPDRYSSLFLLIIGILVMIRSVAYGFGAFGQPGLGFITFLAGMVLSILSLALFVSSLRDPENRGRLKDLWAGLRVGRVLYVLLLLVAYALILRSVGFLIATFVLLCLLFRLEASYRLRSIIILSLLSSAASYVLFDVVLKAQLPKGILGGIL